MNIYDWLKEKQTITTPSGLTYNVNKFKEAVDYIDELHKEIAMNAIYRNIAAEENERINRQRDLYQYGGGKHLSAIQQDIHEINQNIYEVSKLLLQLITILEETHGE